jgi:hypothetical protein
MKKLLTIAMILGAIITLESIQSVNAVVTQPLVSQTDHSQITLACGCRSILP